MSKLQDQDGFVGIEQLPTLDANTLVVDAFKRINQLNSRGFIFENRQRESYVDAVTLAEAMASSSDVKAGLEDAHATLGWLFETPETASAVTAFNTTTLSPDEDPDRIAEAARQGITLVESDADRLGVLFPDLKLFELGTRRIYFVCEDGDRNLSPDQGRCGYCGKPITGTIVA